MKKNIWSFILVAGFLLVSCSSIISERNDALVSDDEVNQIASQLYCPICENVPLDVCPSKACADWRELIRTLLVEGKSAEEIKTYFSEQYGWNVLSMPPRVGFNWIIYVLPPIIVACSVLFVVFIIKKSNKSAPAGSDEVSVEKATHVEEYLDMINRDLKDDQNDREAN